MSFNPACSWIPSPYMCFIGWGKETLIEAEDLEPWGKLLLVVEMRFPIQTVISAFALGNPWLVERFRKLFRAWNFVLPRERSDLNT